VRTQSTDNYHIVIDCEGRSHMPYLIKRYFLIYFYFRVATKKLRSRQLGLPATPVVLSFPGGV